MAIVVIHGGAGVHSTSSRDALKASLTDICQKVLDFIRTRSHGRLGDEQDDEIPVALLAAQYGLSLMEDTPLLNAGIPGSNATLDGIIECDAALMCNGSFGSVGAVPMTKLTPYSRTSSNKSNMNHHTRSGIPSQIVQHPSLLALEIWKAQRRGPDAIGRVPPLTLVGSSAHSFGISCGLPSISAQEAMDLVTPQQLRRYEKHRDMYLQRVSPENQDQNSRDTFSLVPGLGDSPSQLTLESLDNEDGISMDTVGIIVLDDIGSLACGSSSGGISLKLPGRLSHASQVSSAVWALSDGHGRGTNTVGISATGTGEHILLSQITSHLAKELALPFDNGMCTFSRVLETVQRNVFNCPLLARETERHVGAIFIVVEPDSFSKQSHSEDKDAQFGSDTKRQKRNKGSPPIEIGWMHTTQSLSVAYVSSSMSKPSFVMSTQATHGKDVYVDCRSASW